MQAIASCFQIGCHLIQSSGTISSDYGWNGLKNMIAVLFHYVMIAVLFHYIPHIHRILWFYVKTARRPPWLCLLDNSKALGGLFSNLVHTLVVIVPWPDYLLTHWGRDKMAAFSQTTLSNAFSRIKMNEFGLGFLWSLFPRFELTIWRQSGDKPLSEPVMVRLLTHICVTRPQWVKGHR